jgi:hypothetical protein
LTSKLIFVVCKLNFIHYDLQTERAFNWNLFSAVLHKKRNGGRVAPGLNKIMVRPVDPLSDKDFLSEKKPKCLSHKSANTVLLVVLCALPLWLS